MIGRIAKLLLYILCGLFALVIVFLGYQSVHLRVWQEAWQEEVPQLTAGQKEADFEYLTKVIRDVYPNANAVEKEKGLDNIISLENEYIKSAGETKNNQEFLKLFYEYITSLHQAGHAEVVFDRNYNILFGYIYDIKKDAYNKSDYWSRQAASLPWYSHTDLVTGYRDGSYILLNDYDTGSKLLPYGTIIQSIDGIITGEYVLQLQHRQLLFFDTNLRKPYISDPFMIDPGIGKEDWEVEFRLPDGSVHKDRVKKLPGYKPNRPEPALKYDNATCLTLEEDVGYIRIFNFYTGNIVKDNIVIQDFMKQAAGRYKKLIIDVRGNIGGEQDYWMNNLLQPLLKETKEYEQKAMLKKSFFKRMGTRYSAYRMLTNRHLLDTEEFHIKNVDKVKDKNFDDAIWDVFNITYEFKPENSFDFNGQIYVLTDIGSFSAADSFAAAVKKLKLAKVVGSNTYGSGLAFISPLTYALPNSGLMFRLDAETGLNQEGNTNQVYGTVPDVMLSTSTYPTPYPLVLEQDELKKDAWIQWVLKD